MPGKADTLLHCVLDTLPVLFLCHQLDVSIGDDSNRHPLAVGLLDDHEIADMFGLHGCDGIDTGRLRDDGDSVVDFFHARRRPRRPSRLVALVPGVDVP